MPDPSPSSLPPEMVEAVYGVAREAFGVAWTNARVDAICAALAPLLDRRDAELIQRVDDLAVERDMAVRQARVLREALEGFLDAWINCDRTLTASEWEEMDAAENAARAALASSSVTEPEQGTSDSSTTSEVAKSEAARESAPLPGTGSEETR